ncbi:Unknown protein, partial [Striga hermonthica]
IFRAWRDSLQEVARGPPLAMRNRRRRAICVEGNSRGLLQRPQQGRFLGSKGSKSRIVLANNERRGKRDGAEMFAMPETRPTHSQTGRSYDSDEFSHPVRPMGDRPGWAHAPRNRTEKVLDCRGRLLHEV